MTGLHIDTEASTQSARRWVEWADQINAARLQVGHEAQRLWLGTLTSWAESSMASAAAELWTVSNFLRLLVQELERLDAVVGRCHRVTWHGHEVDAIPLPHPSGASTWHRTEPGKTLLERALGLVAAHPAWRRILRAEAA